MNTENPIISKYAASFGLALALCGILNAFLVVAKEKSKPVADWMQKVTGHHWVTHVAMVFLLFIIFGWFFARLNRGQGLRISARGTANIVVGGVIAGVFIIIGFYLIAG